MELVSITALGVGGATVIGSALGFVFKKISHKFSDIVLSFAAGIMLAAAVLGLILPSVESGGDFAILITVGGIFAGAACLNLMDKLVPHLHRIAGVDIEGHDNGNLGKVLLFVMAIAIHNLPEGIAAGVGFGGEVSDGIFIATAIALQNIPEGMAVILAIFNIGGSPGRAFLVAAMTGVVEIVGTFIGYFAVSLSRTVLPFVLAFAGGNMLYVIAEEMIPGAHSENNSLSTYFVLGGFCLMLLFGALL